METSLVPISKLVPYANNPRKHGRGIAKVKASLVEYGFRQPIVVDEKMVIVVGHARYYAALDLEMEAVPVHIAHGLSPAKLRAYRLMDNRSHEEAVWDEEPLRIELQGIEEEGLSLDLTGFDSDELDHLLLEDNQAHEDALQPPPINPQTKPGDVWQLGPHRLVCGDSTQPETYTALLGKNLADMVFTDPPYNVAYEGAAGTIANDALPDVEFRAFLMAAFRAMSAAMRLGAPCYVAYSEKETINFYTAYRDAGFYQSSCLIWLKNQFVLGRGDYHGQHEPIIYGWKGGGRHGWYGGRKQSTIMELGDRFPVTKIDAHTYQVDIDGQLLVITGKDIRVEMVESALLEAEKPAASPLHPTMKPIALVERLVKNSCTRDGLVLDPFGGSGTTIMACEATHRRAALIELEPKFCDVICQRWMQATGETAIHAATGEGFAA